MKTLSWIGFAILLLVPLRGWAESEAIEDLVDVLHEQGLIDDETEERILAKHYKRQARAASRAPAVSAGGLDGFTFFGDLRLRYEVFDYSSDPEGGSARDNRYRARYRARLGFTRELTPWATFGFRLASGQEISDIDGDALSDIESRSTNRSLGARREFDDDLIAIDWAYVDFKLHETESTSTQLVAGKFANPFRWNHAPDLIVWDADVTPEGAYLKSRWEPSEGSEVWLSGAYFIERERSSNADPKLLAVQIGGATPLADGVVVGARASGYFWSSLDTVATDRGMLFGNLSSGFSDKKAYIGEVSSYVDFEIAEVPVTLHGTLVSNFKADRETIGGVRVPDEDLAWADGALSG